MPTPNESVTLAQLAEIIAEMFEPKPAPDFVGGILRGEQVSPRGYWVRDYAGLTAWELRDFDPTCDPAAALKLLPLFSRPYHDDGQEGMYAVLTHCWKSGWRFDLMFCHHDGDALEWSVSAPTLEAAICLAFVQAKTGRVLEVKESGT